ncbi:hypothetical protein EDB86DRAFT_2941019 [Lactarius hatsudake]|nr:hypothetical protein EDB86DRAFT_2941019 [Lactarius hatsudake]
MSAFIFIIILFSLMSRNFREPISWNDSELPSLATFFLFANMSDKYLILQPIVTSHPFLLPGATPLTEHPGTAIPPNCFLVSPPSPVLPHITLFFL